MRLECLQTECLTCYLDGSFPQEEAEGPTSLGYVRARREVQPGLVSAGSSRHQRQRPGGVSPDGEGGAQLCLGHVSQNPSKPSVKGGALASPSEQCQSRQILAVLPVRPAPGRVRALGDEAGRHIPVCAPGREDEEGGQEGGISSVWRPAGWCATRNTNRGGRRVLVSRVQLHTDRQMGAPARGRMVGKKRKDSPAGRLRGPGIQT